MELWRYRLAFLLSGILGSTYAQNFYVAVPSTLRLNSEEVGAIAIDGDTPALGEVYIQDYPGKTKNISNVVVAVPPGLPEIFKFSLDVKDFPPNFLTSPGSPKLVSVNARFLNFYKEIIIPISNQTGYMFIQTDKPIYTPKQNVRFRIISLTEDGVPSKEPFQLQIRNPNNIIVEEKNFNDKNKKLDKAFASHIYKFSTYPILGEFSATVRYGLDLQQNSTVHFELREYVLPTFTVELKTPDVILPEDEVIEVEVLAKYVYGKKVKGVVSFRLGVKSEQVPDPVYFAIFSSRDLDKGEYTLRTSTDELKRRENIGWFPGIDKSHLVVEATVVDYATGNREIATDSKGIFSTSPFVISFKRCLSDFKPGLTSIFEADITYVDGRPAEGISTKLTAVADNGQPLQIDHNSVKCDENGRVAFEIQPENHHKTVRLTLETNDPLFKKNQAKKTFEQRAYVSPSNAFIAISRSSQMKLKPGELYARNIHFEPAGLQNIYYLIVARGKIVEMNKLKPGAFKHQRVETEITHAMVPEFRIVVFTHHNNELIADSLKVSVARVCNPAAQVTIDPDFASKEPGSNGKIIIRGTKDTAVGLLGVDEAVYALSRKDLLTKTKLFNKLASHDLGCGPGGGVNVNTVLGNAGIALGTNKYTPLRSHSCVEIKRRKREIATQITRNFNNKDKQCCALGLESDNFERSCEDRKPIIAKMDEKYSNCSEIFMECCLNAKEYNLTDLKVIKEGDKIARIKGEDGVDEPLFLDADLEAGFEKDTTVRSDFRETWIYENLIVGPDNREELGLSLPHSITTWVIQAVSVSPIHGICVAEPKKLVSFKRLFLHLNLPYSVVRNEQVEIQATVFNYEDKQVGANVYMYGVKGLCSDAQPGEKSEKKQLVVDAQSAASVTFSVVPLDIGHFNIRVVVLTPRGNDIIQKQLYVVPEGVTKEIDIPIKLDPTNQQRRRKRSIETARYSDHIDMSQNLQVTTVKLSTPEGFVPGTASCSISALGNLLGPVVAIAIDNPDAMLRVPFGCGEQTMMCMGPTLYTMRYLRSSGKLTAASETKGYGLIRAGYDRELTYRKPDGSFAAFPSRPTSTWLTAFVMKVFSEASTFVNVDRRVITTGVTWLIQHQQPDGSFVEMHPVAQRTMMGGVQGSIPMTAYLLIAFQECRVNIPGLEAAKTRALAYLEARLGGVTQPLPVAIVAYALTLSGSRFRQAANDKLVALAIYDQDNNWMYWNTDNNAQSIETSGYGLLTQLLFNDMAKSSSIANWINSKQQHFGQFYSTQDTVVALHALSEYATREQVPALNLVSNISSSNDRHFHRVLQFHEDNALVLQDVNVDKVGGSVFIHTAGQGVGSMSVKLRYNVVEQDVCKFDVTVNVTESKFVSEKKNRTIVSIGGRAAGDPFPEDLIKGIKEDLGKGPLAAENKARKDVKREADVPQLPLGRRVKRQKEVDDDKVSLKISLCVRYLGNSEAGMSIVDVGVFSGFEPALEDLQKLERAENHLIDKFEKSSRGVVFYLDKVPIAEHYCFSFHVIRQYIVGNTQMSAIKVYDYYNPDATCTKFYSPERNSPMIRTICEGAVCQCAEGGCPPRTPFSQLAKVADADKREELKTIFCDNYDYAWKGTLSGRMSKNGAGFFNISFTVEEVVKEGIEKTADIQGERRTLLARDNCRTANFFSGTTYLVLGKDGQAYKNDNDETWYRYLLDQTSVVYLWTADKQAKDKVLQRQLKYVVKNIKENGCDL